MTETRRGFIGKLAALAGAVVAGIHTSPSDEYGEGGVASLAPGHERDFEYTTTWHTQTAETTRINPIYKRVHLSLATVPKGDKVYFI